MVDSLFFLILISISAVILLPSMTGITQVEISGETKGQRMAFNSLLSVINSLHNFSYMDYTEGGETEMINKYLADILNEYFQRMERVDQDAYGVARGCYFESDPLGCTKAKVKDKDSAAYALTAVDYEEKMKDELRDFIEQQMLGRYRYNLTMSYDRWSISIGDEPPKDYYAESAPVTMPSESMEWVDDETIRSSNAILKIWEARK